MTDNSIEKATQAVRQLHLSENRSQWNKDPLRYLADHGFSFATYSDEAKEKLRDVLHDERLIKIPPVQNNVEISTASVIGPAAFGWDWWKCSGCKVGIGATLTGMSAAIITVIAASVIGTEGAGAAAVPEEVELSLASEAAVVAAESGLTSAQVLKIFVAAFVAEGAVGFVAEAIDEICHANGTC